jgi:hypothetical protein
MGQRALLVIADIGGYTKFMRVHRINLAHAQYVVAQLLEAVIDGAGRRLELAKLEGDAAFFYALLPERSKKDSVAELGEILSKIRRAFLTKRLELETTRVCNCDSCVQAGQLKLKFVAHVGEIAFQKVKKYKELAGVDVIFVHRLLKNSVPIAEYVLMSEPVFQRLDEPLRQHWVAVTEDLEGIGSVPTYYVDLTAVARDLPAAVEASIWRKFVAWLKMTIESVPYIIGVKKSCQAFRNMGDVDRRLAPLSTASLPSPLSPESLPESR